MIILQLLHKIGLFRPKTLDKVLINGRFVFDLEETLKFNAYKLKVAMDAEFVEVGSVMWKKSNYIVVELPKIIMDNIVGDAITYKFNMVSWDDGLPFVGSEARGLDGQWNDCFSVVRCSHKSGLIIRNGKNGGGEYTYTVYVYSAV